MDEDNDGLMVGGEIVLYGFVGDDYLGEGFTPKAVLRALAGRTDDIVVRVNSGGGYATDGSAIYAALKAYPGKVTVRVEGLAASAASLIAMGGDRVEMAPGALLMIHDPRGVSVGTASQMRKVGDDLDKMATTYAAVYSARSGQDADAVRALMLAETWMDGDEAVALGFADAAEDGDQMASVPAFDFSIYSRAPEPLLAMARENGWRFATDNRAEAPTAKEARMSTRNKEAPKDPAPEVNKAAEPEMRSPQPAPEAPKAPVLDARQAVLAKFGDKLTGSEVEGIVKMHAEPGAALYAAAEMAVEKLMKDQGPETRERSRIVDDADERRGHAMIGALANTLFGAKLEGPASEYRGLTLKKLAMELAGNPRGRTDMEAVKMGMDARGVLMMGAAHSISDFTYVTGELMNRQLRAAYNERTGTWAQLSRQRTAIDFRTLYSVQAGADVGMKKVNEDGEYQGTVLTDNGESFSVTRYGRTVLLTFEAVINDDLGAFTRLPGDFARGARNLESGIVWGLVNANGNLSDGTAFFASARKNLAGTGAVISATTIGAARKAMYEQRPLGADPKGNDFIAATPDLIYVPPALEITALQFVTATTPETDGNVNPFKGTLSPVVEPRLGTAVTGGSETAWYLFDSSMPPMEHAFLQGYEAPTVETMDKVNPRGVEMVAEHIFGAALVEPRGAWKNPGA